MLRVYGAVSGPFDYVVLWGSGIVGEITEQNACQTDINLPEFGLSTSDALGGGMKERARAQFLRKISI